MATLTTNQLVRKLNKLVKKTTNDKQMRRLGNISVRIIKDRTRDDYKGVTKPRGRLQRIKNVSEKYAKWRNKQSNTHPDAPKGAANLRSNLTLTGSMIDNLKVLNATKKEVTIGHSSKKNRDKVIHQANQGRKFMFLAKVEIAQLVVAYEKYLQKIFKKI